MTQEEYDEGLAKGWDADDMLSVGKHKFRRSRFADKMKILPRGSFKPENGATNLENCKVKISMYLDADILEYFRATSRIAERRAVSNADQQRTAPHYGKRFARSAEHRKRYFK